MAAREARRGAAGVGAGDALGRKRHDPRPGDARAHILRYTPAMRCEGGRGGRGTTHAAPPALPFSDHPPRPFFALIAPPRQLLRVVVTPAPSPAAAAAARPPAARTHGGAVGEGVLPGGGGAGTGAVGAAGCLPDVPQAVRGQAGGGCGAVQRCAARRERTDSAAREREDSAARDGAGGGCLAAGAMWRPLLGEASGVASGRGGALRRALADTASMRPVRWRPRWKAAGREATAAGSNGEDP